MSNRGSFNIGDEIRNIVQDAVNNRDFNRLNNDIGDAVNGALDEVRRSIDRKKEDYRNWNNSWNGRYRRSDGQYRKRSSEQNTKSQVYSREKKYSNQWAYRTGGYQEYKQNKLVPVRYTVPVGQVSSTLFTVFGAIGSSAFSLAIIILVMVGYLTGTGGVFRTIALGLLPCFFACMVLSLNGRRIRKRVKRFQRYLSQLHGRNYCLIKDFSAATGKSRKYTIKDLRKMIALGMFPEGHIDDQKTCFMLNGESYEQYLNLQENMRKKTLEEQAGNQKQQTAQNQEQTEKSTNTKGLDPEIKAAIEEGRQFVHNIKSANSAIPGEEISRKLDRLEEVTGKIFDYVELHPEKFPEIKKFTEYFLPTTLKLLNAYREFDNQIVEGENISTAKKEIEKTLDTINLAFENLLDGLFEDAAMDISTDISVLETMFAQEGLTDHKM